MAAVNPINPLAQLTVYNGTETRWHHLLPKRLERPTSLWNQFGFYLLSVF